MSARVIELIESADAATRNQAIDRWSQGRSIAELQAACAELDAYRRRETNLYRRVRALFFLATIYRYHLPVCADFPRLGRVPFDGFRHLLERRFEEAIAVFTAAQKSAGPSETLASALAAAHHALAFQTLADQVRHTVRSTRGNAWMFRLGHPMDQPLRVRPELLVRDPATGLLHTTRERRTGCVFCMFGVDRELRLTGTHRFLRMQQTHPKLYDYCLNDLNIRQVLEFWGLPWKCP